MSKNIREIPITEAVERAIQIARIESTNDESRAWGAAQDTYLQEIPAKEDWTFLIATSALSVTAKYATGTASVNTGATAVTFSSDAAIPAALSGGRIKFTGNANVYSFTRTGATTGTIAPALSGDQNISSGAYTLFQPVYTLSDDFARFIKNGGLTYWNGGQPTPIPEKAIYGYFSEYAPTPSVPSFCRLVSANSNGTPQVELVPAPDKAYVLPYEYYMTPPPLRETTGGTATVSASGTTVTFHAGARVAEMTTGMFFRVDAFGTGADSEWFRINNVSAANSTATITAFGLSGATSAGYTVCMAPQYPIVLHQAVMYGAVKRLLADQKDQIYVYADKLQTDAVADAKRQYKTRVYNQEVDTIASDYQFRR